MLAGIRPPKNQNTGRYVLLKNSNSDAKRQAEAGEKNSKKSAFEESIAAALKATSQNATIRRYQYRSARQMPFKHFQRVGMRAGAKDAEGMVVELEIRFQQDGTVVVGQVGLLRMRSDPFSELRRRLRKEQSCIQNAISSACQKFVFQTGS